MNNRSGCGISVSVIVPVYNAEKYLKKCLESLENQNLQNLEIICVDDGSTDESLQILGEYAKRDSRFKVIHKENGGLVSARKAGVSLASGQYIGYVDSDDWVEPEMYETLYQTAERTQADLISSGYYFEGNYVTEHYDGIPEGLYDGSGMAYVRENTIYNMDREEVGLRGSLCCKLFRADLVKRVQETVSDRLSFSEDKICVLSYVLECDKVYILKQAFYHYIAHPSSMVHAADIRYLISVNEVYQSFIKMYEHPAFTASMRMQAEIYMTELLYKGINSRLGFENSNLFWLDPYYLDDIPQRARVALYGSGALGRAYVRQLTVRGDIVLVGCVDPSCEGKKQDDMEIYAPDKLRCWNYDIVLIAIKNRNKAAEVIEELIEMGILREKIRWYEQKEIFWKYAKVNGWYA